MGRRRWAGSHDLIVSRVAARRLRRPYPSTPTGLPHVQRLHNRTEDGLAVRVLSIGRALQNLRAGRETEIGESEAAMSCASPFERPRRHRKVQGIAAALLPFQSDGRIAVGAFQELLRATHRAGLTN